MRIIINADPALQSVEKISNNNIARILVDYIVKCVYGSKNGNSVR